MSYSQTWLESPESIRGLFIEVEAYNVTTTANVAFYMSNIGFLTGNGVTHFEPIVVGDFVTNESLSVGGGISTSYGSLEIDNRDGSKDYWLNPSWYIWANRSIKVYYGDPTWIDINSGGLMNDLSNVKSKCLLVYDGLIEDIGISGRDRITFRFRDKMERLNYPITETKLSSVGGTWPTGTRNDDTILPLAFGEPFNIQPLLIDPALQKYMVSNGAIEEVLEVRDNTVPIYGSNNADGSKGYTNKVNVNLTNGVIIPSEAVYGQLTATVQGAKQSFVGNFTGYSSSTYNNNIAHIIAVLATQYGRSSSKLSLSELDASNFQAFSTTVTYPVGCYVTDGTSVVSLCSELAASAHASIYFNRAGLLQILRFGVPETSVPSVAITKADIFFGTFEVSDRLEVMASTKLGYCKNWTVQSDVQASIPEEHKDIFAKESLTVVSTNATTKTNYRQFGEPAIKDTLIVSKAAASAEAARVQSYYNIPRTIYNFKAVPRLMSLSLGQPVTLTYDRFNLNSGVSGQVVSISINWNRGYANVGVLV